MNRFVTFPTTYHEVYPFGEMPKRDFLKISLNPYTGNAIMSLKGSECVYQVGADIIRDVAVKMDVLSRIVGHDADLRDFFDMVDGRIDLTEFAACPFCGQFPEYDEETHEITCCGGHAKFYDFSDKTDAIRFWNVRAGKVA